MDQSQCERDKVMIHIILHSTGMSEMNANMSEVCVDYTHNLGIPFRMYQIHVAEQHP